VVPFAHSAHVAKLGLETIGRAYPPNQPRPISKYVVGNY
jgi:hypothetical protein